MIFLLALPLVCLAAFIGYFMGYTRNYTELEFLYFIWPLSFCALISIILYKVKSARRFLLPVFINLSAIVFFYLVDHFNVMVQYDKWTLRGMPGPFETSQMKEIDKASIELNNKMLLLIEKAKKGEITSEELDRESDKIVLEDKMRSLSQNFNKSKITREEFERETVNIKAEYEEKEKVRSNSTSE